MFVNPSHTLRYFYCCNCSADLSYDIECACPMNGAVYGCWIMLYVACANVVVVGEVYNVAYGQLVYFAMREYIIVCV